MIRFVDRFDILFGFVIVIFIEGIFSDCFQYRQWAYGVVRSENVVEKIEENWNRDQLEKSKVISEKMNEPVKKYTLDVYSKWEKLKEINMN